MGRRKQENMVKYAQRAERNVVNKELPNSFEQDLIYSIPGAKRRSKSKICESAPVASENMV